MSRLAAGRLCQRAETSCCKRFPQLRLARAIEVYAVGQQDGITHIHVTRRRHRKLQAIDHQEPGPPTPLHLAELPDDVGADVPQSVCPDLAIGMNLWKDNHAANIGKSEWIPVHARRVRSRAYSCTKRLEQVFTLR